MIYSVSFNDFSSSLVISFRELKIVSFFRGALVLDTFLLSLPSDISKTFSFAFSKKSKINCSYCFFHPIRF